MISAEVALARGDPTSALAFVREYRTATAENPEYRHMFLPMASRILARAGQLEDAAELLAGAGEPGSRRVRLSLRTSRAVVTEARGDHEAAAAEFRELAAEWGSYGFGLEEAGARLGLARCLIALGRDAQARPELERARAVLEPLGARPLLEQVDALLGRAPARG
jgi:tetratricopeptide (TPR) repeat protein